MSIIDDAINYFDSSPTISASDNTFYQATISCSDRNNLHIVLYLPETVSIGVEAGYTPPFAATDLGIFDKPAQLLGIQPITQFLTAKFWNGSDTVGFQIPFFVYADDNVSDVSVLQPVRDLMSLILPSNEYGFLQSPGPSLTLQTGQTWDNVLASGKTVGSALASLPALATSGNASGIKAAGNTAANAFNGVFKIKNQIQLEIGGYIIFTSVVITSVHATFTNMLDSNGKPFCAQINVGFETWLSPVIGDITTILPATATVPDIVDVRGQAPNLQDKIFGSISSGISSAVKGIGSLF